MQRRSAISDGIVGMAPRDTYLPIMERAHTPCRYSAMPALLYSGMAVGCDHARFRGFSDRKREPAPRPPPECGRGETPRRAVAARGADARRRTSWDPT